MKSKTNDSLTLKLAILVGFSSIASAPVPRVRAADRPETAPAKASEPLFEGVGAFGRKVSTRSSEAQVYVDQGLGFLYAFNHDEASRSFRQATELDPDCAMAWWGIAMAAGPHINNPVVPEKQGKAAWAAIEKARSLLSTVSATADRDLIKAAVQRYAEQPPEDRQALDRAYARAMEAVWRDHPRDPDVGALYAEAMMDLRPWDLWTAEGTPQPGTSTVIATLDAVLALQPGHPLACHLYIHAVEASPHPESALGAADRLRLMPAGLPHLIHMPSHIDVRLGRWKEAVVANERAIAADQSYRKVRPRQGFYRLYMLHNRHMLAYAALMRGESERAIAAIDAMIAELPMEWARENAMIADGCFALPLEVRMRFGRWDEILAAPEPEATFPLARALRHAARGIAFAATGQAEKARAAQAEFRSARSKVAADARFGNNTASALLDVAEHLVAGEILYQEGSEDAAFDTLKKAVEAEDALKYGEPPDWIQPVRHALGAALLRSGRFEQAEAVYRDDLKRLPNNGWALFGLTRALELQGKVDAAKETRAQWNRVWKDADVQLSSSCFCLPGI